MDNFDKLFDKILIDELLKYSDDIVQQSEENKAEENIVETALKLKTPDLNLDSLFGNWKHIGLGNGNDFPIFTAKQEPKPEAVTRTVLVEKINKKNVGWQIETFFKDLYIEPSDAIMASVFGMMSMQHINNINIDIDEIGEILND